MRVGSSNAKQSPIKKDYGSNRADAKNPPLLVLCTCSGLLRITQEPK